jgi:hypothetical protein
MKGAVATGRADQMRKVVDSNFLQSNGLREYLATSSDNCAVLTDYAAMEAYKGDTLVSIYRSMEILADYPRQVVVLKGTQTVCGLKAVLGPEQQRQLIDDDQTSGFAEYCTSLSAAKAGDMCFQEQLLIHGREATAHMERMLADAPTFARGIDGITDIFTATELRALRTRAAFTHAMLEKITKGILTLAAFLFSDHPGITRLPDAADLPGTFIFRTALCGYLLAVRWIEVGGASKVNPERMRNDLVDINFAAYATYFDGLLTADKKLDNIYQDAVYLLGALFVAPPS